MGKMSDAAAAWKPGVVDWKRLTKLNIERLQSLMKADGIDALFVQLVDSFQYVTGYMNPTYWDGSLGTPHRQCALLLANEEEPVMLPGVPDYQDAINFYWIKDVRGLPANHDTWAPIIAGVLHDYGLSQGTIAIDPYTMYTITENLKQELGKGFTFVNAAELLDTSRMIKNEEEIKVIRKAAGLTCAMIAAAKEAIKEGVRELDVSLAAEWALHRIEPRAHSACKYTVMSGDRGAYLDRISSEKVIQNGDIVGMDGGCYYMGYLCEFSRHVMVGRPTDEQKRLYRTAWQATRAVIDALKPGAKASELDKIARDIIEGAGFGEYQHPHYTGHGHGLGPHDPPIIGDPGQEKEYIMEPGMVIAIEPGIFKPGVGGVRVEDVAIINETGREITSLVGYEDKLLYD